MQIDKPNPAEHAEFLALVDAEIRPHRANTHAWDDFPLILHDQNRAGSLVAKTKEGEVVGGIAALIREFTTNYANVPVAGIGSVVTKPEFQGQGISRALQNAMLAELRGQDVPLAVLWTDQPEIYAGRGFVSAGWEFHLELASAEFPDHFPGRATVRPITPADVDIIAGWYTRHACRTVRLAPDARQLYLMPGTQGLVLECESDASEDRIKAAVFCGKGADFCSYVLEWDGDEEAVIQLLAHVRHQDLARHILVPAGEEAFAETLVNMGAGWEIRNSGFWRVMDPAALVALTDSTLPGVESRGDDPRYWLGGIDDEGGIQPGFLKLGVWGFDSV